MNKNSIKFDHSVQGRAKVGFLQFTGLTCKKRIPEMWDEIAQLEQKFREKYSSPSDALEELKPARQLYHEFKMEPTRFRPSSEALLRRIIKNKPLYQINSIVDMGNYASLNYLLPIGLYDLDKVNDDVSFRLGFKDEEYAGIGKEMIHVYDRLTLADQQGPFGNPSADSDRTKIDLSTRNILLVIFAHATYPDEIMKAHIEFAGRKYLQFHPDGKLVSSAILT